MDKKASDSFLDYIVASEKTGLTADMLFEEFKNSGYFQAMLDSIPVSAQMAVSFWGEPQWKAYIYNYAKLQFSIRAKEDRKYSKIIA